MKRCPQCNRVESDNSLAFCRVDGTALIQDSVNEDSGTIRFNSAPVSGEAQTNVLPSEALTDPGSRPVAQTTVLSTQAANENPRRLAKRKSSPLIIVLVGVIVATAIVGGYFYLRVRKVTAIESIAVMPFVNESGNPDVDYLSDGMTETLIKSLSQVPNLALNQGVRFSITKERKHCPRRLAKI